MGGDYCGDRIQRIFQGTGLSSARHPAASGRTGAICLRTASGLLRWRWLDAHRDAAGTAGLLALLGFLLLWQFFLSRIVLKEFFESHRGIAVDFDAGVEDTLPDLEQRPVVHVAVVVDMSMDHPGLSLAAPA